VSDEPLCARVIPDVKRMHKELDYVVPERFRDHVRVGTIVRIPLGPRRERAWVTAVGVDPPAGVALREITKVTGWGPPPEIVDLARWAAWRWAGTPAHFLVTASPDGVVGALPARSPRRVPVPGPYDPLAVAALDGGGGVLRRPPADDRLPAVLAAVARGPALVITPSADDARVLAVRLRRAGVDVALHPDGWAAGATGATVVGARSAMWAPVGGLSAIVVLDEHDEGLQAESAPTWHARDVAIERARRAGVPCLLVSPAPSLEALAWASAAGLGVHAPGRSDERAGWPVLDVVDRSRDEPWAAGPVSVPLERFLRDPSLTVLCVLNAPGRARRLVCRACRATARCEVCDAAVGQTVEGILRCGRCGTERPVVCQHCGSTDLVPLRPGVAGLHRSIARAAGREVVEVTGATPIDQPLPDAGVYLGTEAVLHRVPRADVVAFVDFDSELLASRFRAAEQALTLLVRAARLVGGRGAAGHGRRPGRVLVQTRLPNHEVLAAALHADPDRLARVERERRVALGFPPARALAVVEGAKAEPYVEALREVTGVEVLGPADGRFLVRAATWPELADGLASAARPASGVRVEVDPRRL
jgi:primosomal protein N' (replication factor Y)